MVEKLSEFIRMIIFRVPQPGVGSNPAPATKKNDYSDRMVVLFCVCVRKDTTSLRAKRVHHFSKAEHHCACGHKMMLLFEQTVLCSAQMMYCFAITMLHLQIYAIIYHEVVKDERG